MIYSLQRIYSQLLDREFRILDVAIKNIDRYEYIPLEIFIEELQLPRKVISEGLEKLTNLKLLVRDPSGVPRYRLTFSGLSISALRRLANRGVISALGGVIGVGKESVVYLGKNSNDNYVAIKIYRVGFKSFRHFKRKRSYAYELGGSQWLLRSIASSEREYYIFNRLSEIKVSVPKPYSRELNALVMEYIDGVELYKLRNLRDPRRILYSILDNIRRAYTVAGVVHMDLSAYNIMVRNPETSDEDICIFDWPQWISVEDPGHERYLMRDLDYIIRFFRNRFEIKDITLSKAYEYVTGRSHSIE
ncbi:MAG: RIO1 family regulatory kinase/ATPase [Sulfolobales archaeon]